jgi:hypothetical protein
MPEQQCGVIPIRHRTAVPEADELVSHFAYTLWQSSAFRGGLSEEAFLTALRMIKKRSLAGLFLVPRRKRDLRPIVVMKKPLGWSIKMNALLVLEDPLPCLAGRVSEQY